MLEVGKLLWRDGTVCVIVRRDADSALVRFIGMMICDHHIFRARLEPRPNHRYARQGRRHPLRDQLRHLSAAPRQHRRRAACRRPARDADDAVNTHQAQGRLGGGHGDDGLRHHQQHLAHRNRGGARAPLAPQSRTMLTAGTGRPPPHCASHPARAHAVATLALRAAGTPDTTRVTAHAHCRIGRSHRTAARALTPHCEPHAPRPPPGARFGRHACQSVLRQRRKPPRYSHDTLDSITLNTHRFARPLWISAL